MKVKRYVVLAYTIDPTTGERRLPRIINEGTNLANMKGRLTVVLQEKADRKRHRELYPDSYRGWNPPEEEYEIHTFEAETERVDC
jgi:hypothetical protein